MSQLLSALNRIGCPEKTTGFVGSELTADGKLCCKRRQVGFVAVLMGGSGTSDCPHNVGKLLDSASLLNDFWSKSYPLPQG